jgi:hypothetical protein
MLQCDVLRVGPLGTIMWLVPTGLSMKYILQTALKVDLKFGINRPVHVHTTPWIFHSKCCNEILYVQCQFKIPILPLLANSHQVVGT